MFGVSLIDEKIEAGGLQAGLLNLGKDGLG